MTRHALLRGLPDRVRLPHPRPGAARPPRRALPFLTDPPLPAGRPRLRQGRAAAPGRQRGLRGGGCRDRRHPAAAHAGPGVHGRRPRLQPQDPLHRRDRRRRPQRAARRGPRPAARLGPGRGRRAGRRHLGVVLRRHRQGPRRAGAARQPRDPGHPEHPGPRGPLHGGLPPHRHRPAGRGELRRGRAHAGHRPRGGGPRARPRGALRPTRLPLRLQRRPGEAAAGRAGSDPRGRRGRPAAAGVRRRGRVPGRHRPVR